MTAVVVGVVAAQSQESIELHPDALQDWIFIMYQVLGLRPVKDAVVFVAIMVLPSAEIGSPPGDDGQIVTRYP